MPTPAQITHHSDPDPDENPWVHGAPEPETVAVVPYNPDWPARYARLAAAIRDVLGARVLQLDHVGSTSVPGLEAKDIIDIDLIVADPRAEDAYLPPLAAIGYDLHIREPSFHEHRCLRLNEPRANLHVFGPEAPEPIRHRLFTEWLRTHPDERDRYAEAKHDAVPGGGHVMDYNARKQDVIREIYDRAFTAAGLFD